MPQVRKKLIEVSLPLEAINTASAREKSIRHGHPSTLHLWWARRPLAACRAVLFAQLVDDPSSWPDRFPTEAAQEAERKRLHDLIARMVPWEATNNEAILNEARFEIAKSIAWGRDEEPPLADDPAALIEYLQINAPPVYDPFCGGGSIPLEAQRLGLRAYGSDLNPVAVLISKALVEIPPKFAGLPPVNPDARAKLARGGSWSGHGATGLAEDLRYYGRRMRDEAEKRIGHLYPKARLADGTEATVIAWLWARTVRSPDPAAKGARVPLVSTFMLSTKAGSKSWIEPVIDATADDGWRVEIKTGQPAKSDEARLKKGTVGRSDGGTCILSGASMPFSYIRQEGKDRGLTPRLLAIVAEGQRARVYLAPTDEHAATAALAKPTWEPDEELPINPRDFKTPNYGMRSFASLFTPRQLVALTTFSDLLGQIREQVICDAQSSGRATNSTPLCNGGTGATAYGDAVATYLAFALDKLADRGSSICTWFTERDSTRPTFARQAIPMTWDFAELNPLLKGTGSFEGAVVWTAESLECTAASPSDSAIYQIDASKNNFPLRPMTFSTDPPYYDNVGYADLSDYFYVWLRRALQPIWPDLFRRLATPKDEELVATPYRHGGKAEADRFFITGMRDALLAMRHATTPDVPLAIYYAFKQSDSADGSLTSPGWSAFLQAVVESGLVVDGTWPLRTELSNRMIGMGANVLASSIVLACRKRDDAAPVITRTEFLRALRRELPAALDEIREAGIQAVDFQQAAIGPGMGIFSRFAKVMEADDSAMSVRTALALINGLIEELASEQDASYDADTQAALVWYQSYGWGEQPSGHAITLATSKNTALGALFRSGVFVDLRGKVRLTRRPELSANWNPEIVQHFTLWEAAQHLARVLDSEEGGIDAAARIFGGLGARAADVLPLVYRLYQIAGEQRKEQAEALVWNRLATEWPMIERRAAALVEAQAPAEPTLFG